MKTIAITLLFLHSVDGSNTNIKVLTTETNKDDLHAGDVKLRDPFSLTDGVGGFSICYRYFLQRLTVSGQTDLMKFDHNGREHILTYLIWTVDGSTVQLFQKFFYEHVQQGRSGFLDQVKHFRER